MDLLSTITELSHAFGTSTYVRGGGGNSSCKDADTLWVKPSGTTLAGMKPETFVAMDRDLLGRLYDLQPPQDATAREALVQQLMAAAVKPERPGRPSVEAPLHNAFKARYVVHTHPAPVNGLTCSVGGAAATQSLFPAALWVPYIDPGYTLCLRVRREIAAYAERHGREPAVLLLENHGIFVAGDTDAEIRSHYAEIMGRLAETYAAAGVPGDVPVGPAPADAAVAATATVLREALGNDAAVVRASGSFGFATGPVSPDHIVYAKSFPYEGVLRPSALRAFAARRGYAPRVVATRQAVYGIGATAKVADLALEFALDAAAVRQLAGAFGGIQYLSDTSRQFIENWEVESYRARQV